MAERNAVESFMQHTCPMPSPISMSRGNMWLKGRESMNPENMGEPGSARTVISLPGSV